MNEKALTSKQQRVLNAIREFFRHNNRFPTYKQLTNSLGYSSPNSIQQFIRTLTNKGYLNFEKGQGIIIKGNNPEIVNIPLVGKIACGTPITAIENVEGYIPVDRNLLRNKSGKFFFLTATGDSMNRADIDDRDLLLVESKQTATSGDIVVALIGDEATVKIFKPQNGFVILVPKSSNPKYKPIIMSEDFSIQGIVRKVIKKKLIN